MQKYIAKHLKNFVLINLAIYLSLSSLCFAEVSDNEGQISKDYGPEYFFAIEGEVSGQAAPGVQYVHINGKPVAIDKNLNFKTKVFLKEGEKYLSIETRYKGLLFTKKYLVIRHPKAPKIFKVHVPVKEYEKIVAKKPPVPKKRIVKKKKIVEKPKPKASFGFKEREFKDRYNVKALAQVIEADDYGVSLSSPRHSLKWLNELLRTPNFYDIWLTKNKKIFVSADLQRLIDETRAYRNKPFDKLTREQQLKIIRLNRLLLEATYPLFCPKSRPEGVEVPVDKWLGFEFVAELAPEKLLVVRQIDGKYFALLYDLETKIWIRLHEITRQELKDLLERGTIPLFIRPEK